MLNSHLELLKSFPVFFWLKILRVEDAPSIFLGDKGCLMAISGGSGLFFGGREKKVVHLGDCSELCSSLVHSTKKTELREARDKKKRPLVDLGVSFVSWDVGMPSFGSRIGLMVRKTLGLPPGPQDAGSSPPG